MLVGEESTTVCSLTSRYLKLHDKRVMKTDRPELVAHGTPANTERWSEISQDCYVPRSFAKRSLEFGAQVGGLVLGSLVGSVAGAVRSENPIGAVFGSALGMYDGWVWTGRLIDYLDPEEVPCPPLG
jgi:hypothetical protein